ncbi:hypothetical protein BH11MYX4_BH11MYX4_38690 [soil metagenome]
MIRWTIAPLFAIGLGGCALDGGSADPGAGDAERNVGSVEQEIVGIGMTGLLSCSSLTGGKYLLGPDAFGQRCYISGVKGDLTLGGVALTHESSKIYMTVRPRAFRTLAVAATCITGVDIVPGDSWSSAQGTAADLGVGSNRPCAISGITNTNGEGRVAARHSVRRERGHLPTPAVPALLLERCRLTRLRTPRESEPSPAIPPTTAGGR